MQCCPIQYFWRRLNKFNIARCDQFNIVNVAISICQYMQFLLKLKDSNQQKTSRWKIDHRPSPWQAVYWPYCKCQLRRTLKRTISLMWNSPLLERGQHAIRVWCQMIGWAGSLTVEPDPGTPRPRKKCWRIVYICLQFPPSLNLWMPSRI